MYKIYSISGLFVDLLTSHYRSMVEQEVGNKPPEGSTSEFFFPFLLLCTTIYICTLFISVYKIYSIFGLFVDLLTSHYRPMVEL